VPFGKDVSMPKKFPKEFQRDVVSVAPRGGASRAEVAADFGVSESTLKRWLTQADVDDGIKDGLTSAEQNELVQLRRKNRRLEMENEILRRAAAFSKSHG
jgi:transposase